MSTPSSRLSSPNRSSTPSQLTADEELEAFMREPTPMLTEGVESEEEGQQGSLTSGTSGFDFCNPNGINPSSGPVRSNEQRLAHQLALRMNLHSYQRDTLDQLVVVCPRSLFLTFNYLTMTWLASIHQGSNSGQNIRIFIQLCALENKLEKIVSDAAPYAVTVALKVH